MSGENKKLKRRDIQWRDDRIKLMCRNLMKLRIGNTGKSRKFKYVDTRFQLYSILDFEGQLLSCSK